MILFRNPWDLGSTLEDFSKIFGHQEDQEGEECPKHGVLEDFGCLDGYFVIVNSHMIHFCNPWDIVSILEGCTGFFVTIMKIRKVKNVKHMAFWRILSCFPHIHIY